MREQDLWQSSAPDTDSVWAHRAMLCSIVPCLGPLPALACLVPAVRDIRNGRTGRWMVFVAVGAALLQVVAVAVLVALIARDAAVRTPGGTIARSGQVSFYNLRVGDCLGDDPIGRAQPDGTHPDTFRVVPCTSSHIREVFARPVVGTLAEYPGDAEVGRRGDEACDKELAVLPPRVLERGATGVTVVLPTGDWFGRPDVVCLLDVEPRTSSLLDQARR